MTDRYEVRFYRGKKRVPQHPPPTFPNHRLAVQYLHNIMSGDETITKGEVFDHATDTVVYERNEP